MAVNFFPEVGAGGTGSLDDYITLTEKGSANGVATLDSTSKIPSNQLPNIAITDTFIVNSESELLTLTAQVGDVAIRTDFNKSFILQSEPASVLGNWVELLTPTDSVLSVDGRTGAVDLADKYQGLNNELTAISALTDTPGFIKKTGDGTYSIDANAYLTNNQVITLSGDVTGSGTTAIAATLPNIVTAGTSAKPTYNTKGLVIASGSLVASDIPGLDWSKIETGKPTTLSGYGITDALTIAGTGLTSTGNTINAVGTAGRIVANANSLDLATIGSEGTYTKITTDAYGRAITGTILVGSDIPNIDASKITTGTIPDARLVGAYTNISSLARDSNSSAFYVRGGINANGNGAMLHLFGSGLNAGAMYLDAGAFNFRDLPGTTDCARLHTSGFHVYASTASTSTTTGAITTAGGVGVQGSIFAGLLNGLLQLRTFTTATRPVASAGTLGQAWLNTTTGKIEYVATSSTIQTITSA